MEPVARVAAADLHPDDFVRQFVAENTPVILEGALSPDWQGPMAWTPEALARLAPPGASVRVAPLMEDGRDKWVESADLWPGASDLEALPGVLHEDFSACMGSGGGVMLLGLAWAGVRWLGG